MTMGSSFAHPHGVIDALGNGWFLRIEANAWEEFTALT
jgi:hypothetical protein